jgi:hypothetical protein
LSVMRLATSTLLLLWPLVAAGKVTKVEIFPSFETAGILITLDQDPQPGSVTVEVQAPGGNYTKAHPFVRYDARHMATSLFDLKPGTGYSVRVSDGSTPSTHNFSTRNPFALPPPANTVKVSNTGALQSALQNAKAGDLILVAPGSYTGGLSITNSGTAQQPIVIRGDVPAAELAKPIDQRSGLPVIENGSSEPGIMVTASYVVLEHLQLRNNDNGGVRLSSAKSCVVQNCQIYDNGDWANILIDSGGSAAGHHLIQHNHIADLQHDTPFAIETGGDDTVTYYGIRNDDDPGPCTVIRNNRIEQHYDGITPCPDEESTQDVSESDLDVVSQWPAHDMEVYDNVIVDQRDDAIEADGICVNARLYRNRLGRSGSPVSISPALPGPYFWVRNVMTDFSGSSVKFNTSDGRGTIRNSYFYHNTIVRTDPSSESDNANLQLYDGTPSKLVFFRNNILTSQYRLVVIQEEWTHKPDMDYTLWHTASSVSELFVYWSSSSGWSTDFAGWKSNTGNDAHGVFGAPLLDSNLRIQQGSQAVDKGQVIPGINDGYTGSAPDIGHFELGGPPPPDSGLPQLDFGTAPWLDGPLPVGDGTPSGDGPHGPGNLLEGGCGCQTRPGRTALAAAGLVLVLIGLGWGLRRQRRT